MAFHQQQPWQPQHQTTRPASSSRSGQAKPKLQHIHVPFHATHDPIAYEVYVLVQAILRERLHARAAALRPSSPASVTADDDGAASAEQAAAAAFPATTLLTFTPYPTYTLGRRLSPPPPSSSPDAVAGGGSLHLSAEDKARLTAPLFHNAPGTPSRRRVFHPAVVASPRGGLTTYHGPGQLVVWPVAHLSSPHHARFHGGAGRRPGIGVSAYASLLQRTTSRALSAAYGLSTTCLPAWPGVWTAPSPPSAAASGDERKIAALGVHVRAWIADHGVAINVDGPGPSEGPGRGPESTDPWARFVPCGIEGRDVTSVRRELGADAWRRLPRPMTTTPEGVGQEGEEESRLARCWARDFADELGIGEDGIEGVAVEELVARMHWADVKLREPGKHHAALREELVPFISRLLD